MPYVNYNKVTDWTKERILEKLATDDTWVERAIVVLYDMQTEFERQCQVTYRKNTVGFQVADAKEFSEYAIQLKAGKHLTQQQLASARRPWHRGHRPVPTIAKYRGQLLEYIEAKAKKNLER